MIFLNALLVAGASAAAIPLIIHLLNRTRYKVLDWGAMHLLESAIKINSRRVQWQAWLLLALRMAIPAVLALMLARPVLTAWRTAAGGSGHSVVLIIDNSLSMDATANGSIASSSANSPEPASSNAGGGSTSAANRLSCFERAMAEAQTLVERFGSSTEWTVLTSGGGVIDQTGGASFDRQRVIRKLREIRPGAGASRMHDAIATGLQQLAKARQPRRHLILISDFQRSEFERLTTDELKALADSTPADEAQRVEITFIPVPAAASENLSVQIDRPLGPSVVAHHQSLEVRVSIRNHGRQRVKDLPVILSADGVALASKSVEVAGDSQIFLVFTCQLQTLGSHVLTVSIDETKARAASANNGGLVTRGGIVKADDIAWWSVEVIEPVQVGIVSTRAPNSKSVDDATFLNLALSPYAVSLVGAAMSEETAGWAEAHAGADPIQCEIVQPQQLTDAWLSKQDCVMLTNIPKLDQPASRLLANFVQRGGILMIWAGESLQSQWYNESWGSTSDTPLLPMEYGRVSRPADRAEKSQQKTLKIQSQSYDHPALLFFNRSSNGRLDSVDFSTWIQLSTGSSATNGTTDTAKSNTVPAASNSNLAKTSKSDANTTVMLSLENGEPLLVEKIVDRGRVYQWSTHCGDRWSNLPLREVFVPLMQQLVLYGATASTPPLNIVTGNPLAVMFDDDLRSGQESKTSDQAVELMAPDRLRYRLEVQNQADGRSVQFARTNYPGVYQLSGVRTQPLSIVASPPPEESVLQPMASGAMATLSERMQAVVQPSAEEFWQAELVKQTGREIWRPLLVVLVVFLLAELVLQQSLTRAPA